MTHRPLRTSDIPILQEYARISGFPYPELDHPHIEALVVVVDFEDKPIMACAAKRLIELYLWANPEASPTVKINALDMLHQAMSRELRELGYESAECFLPPQVEKQFGNRLRRTFGWLQNWKSFSIRF